MWRVRRRESGEAGIALQKEAIMKWVGTQRDQEGVGDDLGNGIPDH